MMVLRITVYYETLREGFSTAFQYNTFDYKAIAKESKNIPP